MYGWFAALSPRERGHEAARDAYADATRRGLLLVTTPLVAAEMHTLLLRLIRRFSDNAISLADAVSFEVMRRERITRALTFDRHFADAGFEILS